MTQEYEVVIYGASGYTGKLTAWKLAERGIPFIAAGRSQARVAEAMERVPELGGHDYMCVGVANEKEALADPKVQAAIAGKSVVKVIVIPDKLVNIVIK